MYCKVEMYCKGKFKNEAAEPVGKIFPFLYYCEKVLVQTLCFLWFDYAFNQSTVLHIITEVCGRKQKKLIFQLQNMCLLDIAKWDSKHFGQLTLHTH